MFVEGGVHQIYNQMIVTSAKGDKRDKNTKTQKDKNTKIQIYRNRRKNTQIHKKTKKTQISPVTIKQKARLELKRCVGLLRSQVVKVLTANLRFSHG